VVTYCSSLQFRLNARSSASARMRAGRIPARRSRMAHSTRPVPSTVPTPLSAQGRRCSCGRREAKHRSRKMAFRFLRNRMRKREAKQVVRPLGYGLAWVNELSSCAGTCARRVRGTRPTLSAGWGLPGCVSACVGRGDLPAWPSRRHDNQPNRHPGQPSA